MTRSYRNDKLFELFKQEAKVITLKSKSGAKKDIIRWRGTTYQTGSLSEVFDIVKNNILDKVIHK